MKTMADVLDALADRFGRQCLFDSATKKYVDDVAGDDLPARDRRLLKAAFESGAIGKYRSRDDLEEARRSLRDYTCWSDDAVDRVMSSFSEVLGFDGVALDSGDADDGASRNDGDGIINEDDGRNGDGAAGKEIEWGMLGVVVCVFVFIMVLLFGGLFFYDRGANYGDEGYGGSFATSHAPDAPLDPVAIFVDSESSESSDDLSLDDVVSDGDFVSFYPYDFFICNHEVTQLEWLSVMRGWENPSHFYGMSNPVENVWPMDAVNYCNALSKRDGFEVCYEVNGDNVTWNISANGYRLPTVTEWICAASRSDFRYNYIGESAWCSLNSGGKTHPVKEKSPNRIGLYDMSGNVWEWCWDDETDGFARCGGGYSDSAYRCSLNSVDRDFEDVQPGSSGFRVVRSVVPDRG